MVTDIGHGLLFLGLGFALVQFVSAIVGFLTNSDKWRLLSFRSAHFQFIFLSIALALLVYAFVVCDFSLLSVYTNCHTTMPELYRVAGTWGNHEGSLLLWVWILSGVGFLMARSSTLEFVSLSSGIQGLLILIFIIFMWYASDPFQGLVTAPLEGLGLNPLLQDRGLAIHPPFLYLGYVGYSSVFSLTVGAMLTRKIDQDWLIAIAPWSKASWGFLSIGIALGSWWAYYELGWGGWWFWDPVENASLMPWLAGTALLHTTAVGSKANSLWRSNVLLAITTFGLSLCGTFLVRSGLISSIHAFAVAPESGFAILSIISLTMVTSMLLFVTYPFERRISHEFLSREGLMTIGSYLICLVLLIIVWGTFYPLGLEVISGRVISVGAPYFNKASQPLIFLSLALMPIAMFATWKEVGLKRALDQVVMTITPALAIGALLLYMATPAPFFNVMGVSLALWLLFSSIKYIWKVKAQGIPVVLGHSGLALVIIGIISATTWGEEKSEILAFGKSMKLSGFELVLDKVESGDAQNYKFERANISVFKGGKKITILNPERRLYLPQNSILSETSIYTNGLVNIYTSLGHFYGQHGWEIRAMYHPMAPWIWWGGFIMAIGAFVSIIRGRKK